MNTGEDQVQIEAVAAPASPSQIHVEVDKAEKDNAATDAAKTDEAESAPEESKEEKADSAKDEATPESFDAVVRVAKDSITRKLISFVMYRLDKGGKVTLQALSLNVHKAI